MPGNFLPYHYDYMSEWRTQFPLLTDPQRKLIMVSDWHWGHVVQMENTFFPRWQSGDVFDIPVSTYHLSCNAGVELKITIAVTSTSR
jgi:hypothetical protein